jgi:hypothetical protein
MRRFFLVAAAAAFLLAFFVPTALAAQPIADRGTVLVAINRAVDIPAGDQLDTLLVIDGDARISGDVRTIVVAGGTATLSGATAENLTVLNGSADLQAGTTIAGDVRTFRGTVTQQTGASVQGSVTTLDADLAALAVLLIPAFILLFIGLGLTAVVSALLVAAFAARQVRDVESLISREPGQVLVAGIAGTVLLPVIAIVLMMTIVGAPIGLALLFVLLPAMAFVGWIVAAIWIGDWIVARRRGAPEPDRPYRAAVLGVVVLAVAGLLPFVSAIATLFGFGALLVTAWRMLRPGGRPIGEPGASQPLPSAG